MLDELEMYDLHAGCVSGLDVLLLCTGGQCFGQGPGVLNVSISACGAVGARHAHVRLCVQHNELPAGVRQAAAGSYLCE